jgi:hypothetical protein
LKHRAASWVALNSSGVRQLFRFVSLARLRDK